MNIFTKVIISTCILSLYTVQAQKDGVNIINLPTTINNNYLFDGYWGIYNDDKTTNYKISGAKLTNNSTKTSENLYLDLYLVPGNEDLDLTKLPNKIRTNARLGKLEPNGTSFNNVVVTVKSSDIEQFNLYELIPLLVLKDRITNNILNYKVLNNRINITYEKEFVGGGDFAGSNLNLPTSKTDFVPTATTAIPKEINTSSNTSGNLTTDQDANIPANKSGDVISDVNTNDDTKTNKSITKANKGLVTNDSIGSDDLSTQQELSKTNNAQTVGNNNSDINVFNPIPSATPENEVLNPYVTVESTLELGNNSNKVIKLTGTWKLDIDFETMKVSITGDENAIQNYSFKKSNKLRLMLYFSKEDLNVNAVNGYDFASFEIDPIEGAYKLEEVDFYDNITKLVPAGEYFPLLVLKEFNAEKGEYFIRSAIRVGETVLFN